MFNTPYDHAEVQRKYAARICEAQEYHAHQRRLINQFAQLLTWLGSRLVRWSEQLQNQAIRDFQNAEQNMIARKGEA